MSDKDRSDTERGQGGTGLVAEESAPKLSRPPLYQVLLLNDDYTPMEFVVDILQRFFSMDRTKATRVMLECTRRAGAFAASLPMKSPRPRWRR